MQSTLYRSVQRLAVRLVICLGALVLCALLLEAALEARDDSRFMAGQDYAAVGDSRIRYQRQGIGKPGATVVFLSGLLGCMEQTSLLQEAVSIEVPTLAYDRADYCFSRGSRAHSALEQADELAALLQALKIDAPVVLAAYSSSAEVARVFADRHPEKTAGLYLIGPWMPELGRLIPQRYSPRRYYGRDVLQALLAASLGYSRLRQHLLQPHAPESLAEQRVGAAFVGRHHRWAIVAEWYARADSSQQAISATIPPVLPLVLVYSKRQFVDDQASVAVVKMYEALVSRSSRGQLIEFEHVDHSRLMEPSIMFDPMVAGIKQLSRAGATEKPTTN
jgi:pimeloyl-ACP methyl ester carboxylesterase